MNTRTTIILLVVVAVLGIYLIFTMDKGDAPIESTEESTITKKLLDVPTADVTRVTIKSQAGQNLDLVKTDSTWRIAAPIAAPAESWQVESLVNALLAIESTGEVPDDSSQTGALGLESPSFVVELWTKDGKTHQINVGNQTLVGNNLYARIGGEKSVHTISADLREQLVKPANDYRKTQVLSISSGNIHEVTIEGSHGPIVLKRDPGVGSWRITSPIESDAEQTTVSDILFAISGLNAVEYVAKDAGDSASFQLDNPKLTVTYIAEAPSTQPTTQSAMDAPVTIKFGRYDDILKKNLYVSVSSFDQIVKVPATALENLDRDLLELRSKSIVTIDPEKVNSITIRTTKGDKTTSELVLQRRDQAVTVGLPSPASQPATQPATKPAETVKQWIAVDQPDKAVNEDTVKNLLAELNPLRADRYLATNPATQPVGRVTIIVRVDETSHEIQLLERNPQEGNTMGTYSDLTFEARPALLQNAKADFFAPVNSEEPPVLNPIEQIK